MRNARRIRLAFCFITFFMAQLAVSAERIVTLNPMVSEWVAEILGNEKGLKKIIGASEYSHYPQLMKAVPTVGPYPNLEVEKILSLHPDLVIGSVEYNRFEQVEKLKKLKLNVVILPKENFKKMNEWIIELGNVLGEPAKGIKLANDWDERLKKLKSIKSKKKVFLQIQFQPLITVGSDSFLNDVFSRIGYENVFQSLKQSYPKVSKEAVFEKNPDEVFVFEMIQNQEDLGRMKEIWKKSRVTILNGDDFARCSLRLISAAERMMKGE